MTKQTKKTKQKLATNQIEECVFCKSCVGEYDNSDVECDQYCGECEANIANNICKVCRYRLVCKINTKKKYWLDNELLAYKLKDVLVGLNESALFDNDGELMGYVEERQVDNQKELLAIKNELIKQGEMSEQGFQLILFNYGENGVVMPELRFAKVSDEGIVDITNE